MLRNVTDNICQKWDKRQVTSSGDQLDTWRHGDMINTSASSASRPSARGRGVRGRVREGFRGRGVRMGALGVGVGPARRQVHHSIRPSRLRRAWPENNNV